MRRRGRVDSDTGTGGGREVTRTLGVITLLVGLRVAVTLAQAEQGLDDRRAYRAIWNITDTKRRNQATAVAVGATHVLANAHVLYEFIRKESTALVLTDTRGQGTVDIIGPIATSAT